MKTRKYEYVLTRDGKEIGRYNSDIKAIAYVHNHHSFSFDWALKYEGYKLFCIVNDNTIYRLFSDGQNIKVDNIF